MSPRDEEGTSQMNDKDRGLGGFEDRAFRTVSKATSAIHISPISSPGSVSWAPRLTTVGRRSPTLVIQLPPPVSSAPPRPKGPPWLNGYVLDAGAREEFAKLIRSILFDLDAATSKDVVLQVIGNPTELGPRYKKLRDARLRANDEKDTSGYRRERKSGVPASYLRRREEFRLRALLGIELDQLPCIVFQTYPPCASPAFLKIPQAWTKTSYAQRMLIGGLIGFFKTARIDQLARECKTVDELSQKFGDLINGYMTSCMEAKLREEPASSPPLVLDDGRDGTPAKAQESFPTPPGTQWQDVMVWVADHTITIEARHLKRDFTFDVAGFEEERKRGVPDRIWTLLKGFAMCGGVIPFNGPDLPHPTRTYLKQYVSVLRQRLRDLIPGIDGNPVPHIKDERCYKMLLKIASSEGIAFPVPDGAQWPNVTIACVRSGAIRVSIPTTERYAADTYAEEPSGDIHRFESAERESRLERDYDLRMLELADKNRRPNAAGEALIEVLRADGVVSRPADDNAMLHLCGVLSELMAGISGSPFRFAPSSEKWIALFQTSCELP